jgi:xeroderma pigmentosum group C-complementing protein
MRMAKKRLMMTEGWYWRLCWVSDCPIRSPPIVNGRVPKNTYGNLDVYVPSMVPRGGVHLPYPEAARAAKVVGVDYADAVTGFEFKGRHGTAVIKGIVAAVEYREALEEVIEGFQTSELCRRGETNFGSVEDVEAVHGGFVGEERIDGYDVEGERDAVQEGMGKVDEEMEEGDGGGFLPDRDQGGR